MDRSFLKRPRGKSVSLTFRRAHSCSRSWIIHFVQSKQQSQKCAARRRTLSSMRTEKPRAKKLHLADFSTAKYPRSSALILTFRQPMTKSSRAAQLSYATLECADL